MHFNLEKHTKLLVTHGSRAYGMHTEYSDVDLKGVLVAPKSVYLGTLHNVEQVEDQGQIQNFLPLLTEEEQAASKKEKLEGVVYELRKFLQLCSKMNPTILEVLFCRDEEVRITTLTGEKLRENRELFLSTRAMYTYTGYAYAQLNKIKTHRSWLLDPPKHAPTRADFNLDAKSLLPKDQMGAFETLVQRATSSGISREKAIVETMESLGIHGSALEMLANEKRYEAARSKWKSYQQWKKHRNRDRAKLEEKFGYDTKHAAHLVRLLRTGNEVLTTGKLNVWRPDAEELLAIRAGAWKYEDLIQYADNLQDQMKAFYDSGKSPLPKKPNLKKIDALCIQILDKEINNA
jgi:predicted nucleotidyltransferase